MRSLTAEARSPETEFVVFTRPPNFTIFHGDCKLLHDKAKIVYMGNAFEKLGERRRLNLYNLQQQQSITTCSHLRDRWDEEMMRTEESARCLATPQGRVHAGGLPEIHTL
eukprot:scaffold183126_cov81-Cyclotella_meneghiniana.AAC.4